MDFNKVQDENRRAELIRVIEHSVEKLTLPELEALYYDLISKDYIRSVSYTHLTLPTILLV